MDLVTSAMKYVLFSFNLLVMLLGLVMVFIGVVFQVNWKVVTSALKYHLTVAPWVFIIIGSLMVFIAFFGCCGSILKRQCMIITYAVLLLVIIFAQGIIAILFLTSKDTVKARIIRFGNNIFEQAPNSAVLRSITNSLQQQFECCGWSGVEYYGYSSYLSLPDSCCLESNPFFGHRLGGRCTLEYASPGCKRKVEDFYEKWDKHIVGTIIAIIVVEVVSIAFALYLANILRNKRKKSSNFFVKFVM